MSDMESPFRYWRKWRGKIDISEVPHQHSSTSSGEIFEENSRHKNGKYLKWAFQ